MFVGVLQGYFCEREFVADSFAEASQMSEVIAKAGDLPGLRRWFREHAITHVFITKSATRVAALPEYFTSALREGRGFTRLYEGPLAEVFAVAPAK